MILFSNKFRIAGYICLIPAFLVFIAQNILKIELKFLYVPVFAIHSYFFESKYLFWMHSNISDEISAISLIIGLTLIALSKEKVESEENNMFRLKALSLAIILNSIFLIFGMAFFYGVSAIYVLIINIFSFLVFYILIFRITKLIARNKNAKIN